MTDNKITDKITKVSKNSPKNNSETITDECNKKILKEIYMKDRKLLMI